MVAVGRYRIAAPLGERDFRLLWTGQAISALGDPLQAVALAWLVLDTMGSVMALSLSLMALALPRAALTIVGGVISDRLDPRIVMVWSDAARAATVGTIAALAAVGQLPLWLLCVLLALVGAAAGIFSPAANSITPHLVPSEHLQAANALNQVSPQVATVIGAPVAGALVVTLGPVPALVVNAASFACAALAAWAITPFPATNRGGITALSFLEDARVGFTYVRERAWLSTILLIDAALNLAVIGPLTVGLPLLAYERFDGGARVFGLLLAGFGLGSMTGMLLLGFRAPLRRRGRAFSLLQIAQAPLVGGLAFAPAPLALAFLTVAGVFHGISAVTYMTLLQDRVLAAVRGRLMSLVTFVAFGLIPISQLATGALIASVGLTPLFLLSGAMLVCAALAGLAIPALRTVD